MHRHDELFVDFLIPHRMKFLLRNNPSVSVKSCVYRVCESQILTRFSLQANGQIGGNPASVHVISTQPEVPLCAAAVPHPAKTYVSDTANLTSSKASLTLPTK